MIIGLVEHEQGKLNERTAEMLTLGWKLAAQMGAPLAAVVIGEAAPELAERLATLGVSTVYAVKHERLSSYAPEAWARCVEQIMAAAKPAAVMAAGSERGNEVMAYLGALTGLPLAANCTEVQPGEAFFVTRQCWGGTLWEEARIHGSVKLLTVAPLAVAAEEAPAPAALSVSEFTPTLTDKDLRVRVVERIETASGRVTLAEARVVVSGGRGAGSAEGFRPLEELAGLLGAAVGCSRAVTSAGWRPHADQIGQTGTRISPEIYIACGISGATQHIVGCKGSKHILAINTDPEAPIMSAADYAIVGDMHAVVPALCTEIRKRRGAA